MNDEETHNAKLGWWRDLSPVLENDPFGILTRLCDSHSEYLYLPDCYFLWLLCKHGPLFRANERLYFLLRLTSQTGPS